MRVVKLTEAELGGVSVVGGDYWRLLDGEGESETIVLERMAQLEGTSEEAVLAALIARAEELAIVPPSIDAPRARSAVIAAIDRATAAILDAYPRAERLGWDAKANEARAVLDGGESATLELAPLLVAECAAEHGEADDCRLGRADGEPQRPPHPRLHRDRRGRERG